MEFFNDKVDGVEVIEELIVPVSNLLWPPTETPTVGQDVYIFPTLIDGQLQDCHQTKIMAEGIVPENSCNQASPGSINWEKKSEEISQNLEEVLHNNGYSQKQPSPTNRTTEETEPNSPTESLTPVGDNLSRKCRAKNNSHLRIAIEKLRTDEDLNGNLTLQSLKTAISETFSLDWKVSHWPLYPNCGPDLPCIHSIVQHDLPWPYFTSENTKRFLLNMKSKYDQKLSGRFPVDTFLGKFKGSPIGNTKLIKIGCPSDSLQNLQNLLSGQPIQSVPYNLQSRQSNQIPDNSHSTLPLVQLSPYSLNEHLNLYNGNPSNMSSSPLPLAKPPMRLANSTRGGFTVSIPSANPVFPFFHNQNQSARFLGPPAPGGQQIEPGLQVRHTLVTPLLATHSGNHIKPHIYAATVSSSTPGRMAGTSTPSIIPSPTNIQNQSVSVCAIDPQLQNSPVLGGKGSAAENGLVLPVKPRTVNFPSKLAYPVESVEKLRNLVLADKLKAHGIDKSKTSNQQGILKPENFNAALPALPALPAHLSNKCKLDSSRSLSESKVKEQNVSIQNPPIFSKVDSESVDQSDDCVPLYTKSDENIADRSTASTSTSSHSSELAIRRMNKRSVPKSADAQSKMSPAALIRSLYRQHQRRKLGLKNPTSSGQRKTADLNPAHYQGDDPVGSTTNQCYSVKSSSATIIHESNTPTTLVEPIKSQGSFTTNPIKSCLDDVNPVESSLSPVSRKNLIPEQGPTSASNKIKPVQSASKFTPTTEIQRQIAKTGKEVKQVDPSQAVNRVSIRSVRLPLKRAVKQEVTALNRSNPVQTRYQARRHQQYEEEASRPDPIQMETPPLVSKKPLQFNSCDDDDDFILSNSKKAKR